MAATQIASLPSSSSWTVIFVLGGPGAGKGTQCAKIVSEFGFVHLSAGDLLRAHVKSGSQEGNMVAQMIKNGEIVPSEITIGLLLAAMQKSGKNQFLVDGFPRNFENQQNWLRVADFDCNFVLQFECSEAVLEKRLLGRNQGRSDDNIESIRKRFRTYKESTMEVLDHYAQLGKLKSINAEGDVSTIYKCVRKAILEVCPPEQCIKLATHRMLECIDSGDYEEYRLMCSDDMTCFEPEAGEHIVPGMDFHKYFFDVQHNIEEIAKIESTNGNAKLTTPRRSTISGYTSRVLTGGQSVLCAYTRLVQKGNNSREVSSTQETRVWEYCEASKSWRCVHFHRSSMS